MKKATQTKSSRRAKPKTATHEVPVVPATEPPSAAQPSTLTVEAEPVELAVPSEPSVPVDAIVSESVTQPSSEPASAAREPVPESFHGKRWPIVGTAAIGTIDPTHHHVPQSRQR
jgi:hypothetical protein